MSGGEWRRTLDAEVGPLGDAAQTFLREHPGAPSSCPPGVDGLAVLADAIDEWADREWVESAQEEQFVEGAGALLALLLLERLGGAHQVEGGAHRVRVGVHGFFDPFGAVERALEADEARPALVIEVDRAEREAAGTAGVGRATRLLTAELDDTRIESTFGSRVTLADGVELDLSRLLSATEGESEQATRKAVRKLVSMLPSRGGSPVLPWDEARDRLLPRLVRPGFAEARKAGLAHRSVLGGVLELTFVLAYEGRSRYVRDADLEVWTKPLDEATARAVENLAGRSERARFGRVETPEGPLVVARSGDGLDGARLLLPTLHDVLAPEIGSPFFCGVPHRDALYACATGAGPLRDTLRQKVQRDEQRAPHPASPVLFLIDANGPRPA